MSQFKTAQIQSLLVAGCYGEAESYLVFCEEPELTRHWKAKIHLYKNEYSQALQLLKKAYDFNPQNLLVLSDVCLCLYQLGFLFELDEKLLEYKKRLEENLAHLEFNQVFDSGLLISKLLEEMGNFKESREILLYLESQDLSSWQLQLIQIQKLRQAFELSDKEEVEDKFQKLFFGKIENKSYEIEKEHVLLLASSEIFGIEDTIKRFTTVTSQNLSRADQCFFVSEILEKIILKNNLSLLESFNCKILEKSESSYESAQFQVLQDYFNKSQKPSVSFLGLEKTVPRLSYLRLIRQCLFLFTHPQVQSVLQNRFSYMVKSLPDKNLQESFRKSVSEIKKKNCLQLDAKLKNISLGDKQIQFKNKMFWYLIDLLQERQKISIEEFVRSFYQEELNTYHFDRIRITIFRLNKTLKEEFIIDSIFHINKHFIWMEPGQVEVL